MLDQSVQSIDSLLRPNILNTIIDKNQQKRRFGRIQLQRMISYEAEVNCGHGHVIQKVVYFFEDRYLKSYDFNRKIVGLQVMTSIVTGIQNNDALLVKFQQFILSKVLNGLNDSQAKIRCAAIKAVFQIIKVLREKTLRVFNLIFERMIGCICDQQEAVRSSCDFLNTKLKDIIFNADLISGQLQVHEFVAILKRKLKTMNYDVRKFLLVWIKDIMQLNLYTFLPDFLQELLIMISDRQIQTDVSQCLATLQTILKQKFFDGSLHRQLSYEYVQSIICSLIRIAKGKFPSYTKLQTLQWLKLLFTFFREESNHHQRTHQKRGGYFKKVMIDKFDQILEPILLLMSNEEQEVRQESIKANDLLLQTVRRVQRQQPINFAKVVPILKQALSQKKMTKTSQNAMSWISFMLQDRNQLPQIRQIIQKLIQKMYQSNSKIITCIVYNLKQRQDYFCFMIDKTLCFMSNKLSQCDRSLECMLTKFVCKKGYVYFVAYTIHNAKKHIKNPAFMSYIAYYFTSIIVCHPDMAEMRKGFIQETSEQYCQLFYMLFFIMRFNPASILSICLLFRQYELANRIMSTYAGVRQLSACTLMSLCKLVNLLQKPAFTFLRMQMMKESNGELVKCMNTLLMILPQGKIFNMLLNRLDCIRLGWKKSQQKVSKIGQIDIQACMELFVNGVGVAHTQKDIK